MVDPLRDPAPARRPAPDPYADQRCGCGHLGAQHDTFGGGWWCRCQAAPENGDPQ